MPATTPNLGLPYPVGGDPIDVAGDIQRLATAIDGAAARSAYPVGSIYISVLSANPAGIFGGTWVAFGTGRMLIGVDSADPPIAIPELTGGEKTHAITIAELPAHTHPGYAHTHPIDHNHPAGATGGADVSHVHSIAHDHAASAATTSSTSAAHTHNVTASNIPTALSNGLLARSSGGTQTNYGTDSEAGHTHTTTINLPAFSGNSGGQSVNHTHTVDFPTFTGSSGAATAGTTGSAGSGTPMPQLPPFISVYMWKRTA
jgi:hypothetical protein